jgi:hypothetical protein
VFRKAPHVITSPSFISLSLNIDPFHLTREEYPTPVPTRLITPKELSNFREKFLVT